MNTSNLSTWPEDYATKLMPVEEAAKLVQNGDNIVVPPACLVPTLDAAIYARADELRDIDYYMCGPLFDPGWWDPGHPNVSVHAEFFLTPFSRIALNAGRADFTSVSFSTRFKPLDERNDPVHAPDVCLVSVSPPDRFGYCSFGLGMWSKATYARKARTVLAEINEAHPRTYGDNRIHVSEIDAFVEAAPLPMINSLAPEPAPTEIAGYVNELINDGDCIQIGTGGLSNSLVLNGCIEGKQDLGVHAELSIPGMTRGVREGIITGARKNFHPGKYVTAQLEARSQEDLDFIHENPIFEVYDVGYVNDPRIAAQNDNLLAINNTLAIDFNGQITAESVDGKFWSGPGGQQDFALAATFSKGGKNISVQLSSASDGTVSRIVPELPAGTIITVPRQLADFVVTEYGIASLFGKSDRERALELISIAHPDHRADLKKAAANHWVLPQPTAV